MYGKINPVFCAFLTGICTLGLGRAFADATNGATEPSGLLDEIVVSGIRASVQAAQEIKRQAPSVVEAITSEDLGKFTDSNITDALQRVPGINIERSAGTFDSGYGVTIRGLGAQYSSSTLNGRDLLGITDFFGGGGRQFDFQTIPPEILSGVTVYKTSTASQVEPGLSGQVNLQTLRPLDYNIRDGKSFFGSVSASDGYENQSKKSSPRFGGTIGTKLFDNTLGIYVAALYANDWADKDLLEHYAGNVDFTLDNGKQYKNTLVNLYGYDIWRAHEERTKRSVASGLQWRPTDNWEVNGDFEYNKSAIIRRDQSNYWYPAIGGGNFGSLPIPASALTFGGTGPGVVGWDATKIPGLGAYSINYLGALHIDYTNTNYNGGLNTVWKNDADTVKVSGDYAYSKVDYFISWLHPYIDNGLTSKYLETVDASGNRPAIGITNVGNGGDVAAPGSYLSDTYAENFQTLDRSHRNAGRLDFDFKLNDDLTFRMGGRRADSDTLLVSMAIRSSQLPTSVANAFTGGVNHLPFTNFATPAVNFDGFCASNPVFCQANNRGKGSFVGDFPTTYDPVTGAGKPGDVLGLNTGQSYEVVETNTAFYGQLDFQQNIAGIKSSGNVGIRAVRITEEGKAFQGSCIKIGFDSNPCVDGTSAVKLVEDSNRYWTYLPSFNFSLFPTNASALRFSVAKTMTLPTYFQLAPIGKADIVMPDANGVRLGNNIAATGNTKLKPTQAINYDVTGEYYTSYGGSYITSLFYKDVKDLIITQTLTGVTVPGQGNTLFDSTTSLNASTGKTYGAELGTNQPFTFLPQPWDGFGLQANYTFVQSTTNIGGRETRFPGSSKNNLNLSTYYEKFGFSARLAYSYRSAYLSGIGGGGDGDKITRAAARLDASLSYTFLKNFEVILTGSNLTHSYRSIYDEKAGFVSSYYSQPTVYSLGARASF